jgi:hypothetical protein
MRKILYSCKSVVVSKEKPSALHMPITRLFIQVAALLTLQFQHPHAMQASRRA